MKKLPPDSTRYFQLSTTHAKITAILCNDIVTVFDADAIEDLWYGGFYGSGGISKKYRDVNDIVERCLLSPEETIYLLNDISILRVCDERGNELDLNTIWGWAVSSPRFIPLYLSYRFYRMQGIIVRSGIKYGCEWLLYEKGPVFDHAFSCVKVGYDDATSWHTVITASRIAGNVRKSLRVCLVNISPKLRDRNECLENVLITDIDVRRWAPERTKR